MIIANLLSSPLTILYGSSGWANSVLMAGVVPQLHRERPRTPVVVFRNWVDRDFQLALTRACIETVWAMQVDQPRPAETLPLDEVLRACAEAAHGTILVIFDQFEEYFLYHAKDSEAAGAFEAQFARAVNRGDVDVGFLVALRDDSLSRLDRFRGAHPQPAEQPPAAQPSGAGGGRRRDPQAVGGVERAAGGGRAAGRHRR